jgi:hypothetical protein
MVVKENNMMGKRKVSGWIHLPAVNKKNEYQWPGDSYSSQCAEVKNKSHFELHHTLYYTQDNHKFQLSFNFFSLLS